MQRLILALSVVLLTEAPQSHGMNDGNQNSYDQTTSNNEQLIEAAKQGSIERLQELIHNGADINSQNMNQETPLHLASKQGHPEIAQLLINNGAHVNVKSNHRAETPLHRAADQGYLKVAQLLINNDADVNAQNNIEGTPLHCAADQGYPEVARLLIKNGTDFNAQDKMESTAYQLANSHPEGLPDITTLCNRISSLTNNDISSMLTDNTLQENATYYTQAMIAYGYCDVARRIISEHLNPLSDDEYADIIVHAIRHRHSIDHSAYNQFITDMREHEDGNRAQAVVNKAWSNVQDGYASPQAIMGVLNTYEDRCRNFCDDDGNTIAHLSISAQLNGLLPHITTLVMQNKNHKPRNNNNKTPVMLRREIGNNEGADIIRRVVHTQNIFSPIERDQNPNLNHFLQQLDEEKNHNTNQIDPFAVELKAKVAEKHKAKAERTRSNKITPPEITDHIIAWIPGKQMLDTNASQHD